ncbi:unnamed protein product [Euphydryas editha]|uniref:TIL domain-containing protein n=1 Tax=Euphydryas editha TaxID=104508 RepID=A0AAU9V801_EUPED|nr:unnamed protein product [Euphydryas editha]
MDRRLTCACRTPCPKPKECPPPACKCGFNYRRADNGTCIPTTECPPFKCSRINEEFNPCPSYCPSDNCHDASRTGECPYFLLLVVECSPTCRCIKHHWRKDGVCVPYEECPDTICGPNEVERESSDYQSDYCLGAEGDSTANRDPYTSACKCGLMYRRAANNTCIPTRSCPPIPCGENEVYDSCPVCSEKCENASPTGERCRFVGRIGITVICNPACRCVDFYWRNYDDKCVPYDKCRE